MAGAPALSSTIPRKRLSSCQTSTNRNTRNTGKLDVRRFILRRGLKIWPSYYLLILATMLFYVFIARASEHPFPKHEVAVSALFIRNYFGADGFNFLAHTWSLAVE